MGPQQSALIGLSVSLFSVCALFLFKGKYQSEMVRGKNRSPGQLTREGRFMGQVRFVDMYEWRPSGGLFSESQRIGARYV